jgi:hypothetical protein
MGVSGILKVSFDIDDSDNAKLEKKAESEGRTKANLLRIIVKEYLK